MGTVEGLEGGETKPLSVSSPAFLKLAIYSPKEKIKIKRAILSTF
jgi:hypothetical protein